MSRLSEHRATTCRPVAGGFTLVEVLVALALIVLLAAVVTPVLLRFKQADAMHAATRQLLDDVAHARQLALSQRTTVYMVFCPADFWSDPAYASLPQSEKEKAAQLYGKQLSAYTFVTVRDAGSQPGSGTPQYHGPWRSLPEGAMIAPWQFGIGKPAGFMPIDDPTTPAVNPDHYVAPFNWTRSIPFPSEDAYVPGGSHVMVPYLAFNHFGQLITGRRGAEAIALAKGTYHHARDLNQVPLQGIPTPDERPAGNSTNAFNLVQIDWLTGRASLEQQKIP